VELEHPERQLGLDSGVSYRIYSTYQHKGLRDRRRRLTGLPRPRGGVDEASGRILDQLQRIGRGRGSVGLVALLLLGSARSFGHGREIGIEEGSYV
jgi:hypothetical protein